MKLYCIVSAEAVKAVNGNRGKMIAQGGHAYVGALLDARARFIQSFVDYYYDTEGNPKICLIAPQERLIQLRDHYELICGTHLVTDSAKTVFNEPTITALGLGPLRPDQVIEELSELKGFI